jgi:hypothetical protein
MKVEGLFHAPVTLPSWADPLVPYWTGGWGIQMKINIVLNLPKKMLFIFTKTVHYGAVLIPQCPMLKFCDSGLLEFTCTAPKHGIHTPTHTQCCHPVHTSQAH